MGSTDCVFPFSFQGKVYRSCTKDHSENGQPWCATQVDDRGIVINGKWGDCKLGCPGSGKTIEHFFYRIISMFLYSI